MKKNYSDNSKQLRAQIQKEINAHKIDIDRTVFHKTEEEKALLWQAKREWKNRQ